MNQLFILQNQDKHFFGKNKEWVDGYDANSLFRTEHKDEAINQMVEISSKDYTQRVKVIACNLDEKGLPLIDINIMPPPLPKAPKPAKTSDIPASVVDLFAAKATDIDEEADDIEIIDFAEDPPEDAAGEQKPLI
ncbi:MAG TPA: hypothetical protein VN030_05030 [Cellvibrio sp.]|nr:hypothetical protein [Cellvibrio sp.]